MSQREIELFINWAISETLTFKFLIIHVQYQQIFTKPILCPVSVIDIQDTKLKTESLPTESSRSWENPDMQTSISRAVL